MCFEILLGCTDSLWVSAGVYLQLVLFVFCQVPRILGPLVLCLDKLPELYAKPSLKLYFDSQFGGLHRLRSLLGLGFIRVY